MAHGVGSAANPPPRSQPSQGGSPVEPLSSPVSGSPDVPDVVVGSTVEVAVASVSLADVSGGLSVIGGAVASADVVGLAEVVPIDSVPPSLPEGVVQALSAPMAPRAMQCSRMDGSITDSATIEPVRGCSTSPGGRRRATTVRMESISPSLTARLRRSAGLATRGVSESDLEKANAFASSSAWNSGTVTTIASVLGTRDHIDRAPSCGRDSRTAPSSSRGDAPATSRIPLPYFRAASYTPTEDPSNDRRTKFLPGSTYTVTARTGLASRHARWIPRETTFPSSSQPVHLAPGSDRLSGLGARWHQ